MASNVFEGARRISWTITAIIIVIIMFELYEWFYCVPEKLAYYSGDAPEWTTCSSLVSVFETPFWFLLGLWVFTWTIGWIVRGFFRGIPRGQDKKE